MRSDRDKMFDRPISALTQEGPVYFPPSNTFFTSCPFRKDVRGRSWKHLKENAWPSVFRLLSTVGRSQIHTRDRPPPFATHTPLLKHSKTSWLRLTVPPSASTSAPPTPASASGSTTGASLRRFFPSHFAFPPPPQIGASESAPDLVDRGVSGAPKRLMSAAKHRRTRIDPHTAFEHVADRAVPPLSSPAASRSSPTTRATAPPRPTSPSPIPSVSSVMPPRTR